MTGQNTYSKLGGRQVRWQFEYHFQETRTVRYCGRGYKVLEPYAVDQEFERYNERLYMDVARTERAIRNWQRVKVMLSLLKSLNQSQASIDVSDDNEVEEVKKSCCASLNKSLSKMTVRPDTRYKLIWDLVANSAFLIGFFSSCIALGFRLP